MKRKAENFRVVPALTLPNVYFIFRTDGGEIKVTVKKNEFFPNKLMLKDERLFFRNYMKQSLIS